MKKKKGFVLVWVLAGLLLLAGIYFLFIAPSIIVVPSHEAALLLPVPVAVSAPSVIFIGVSHISPLSVTTGQKNLSDNIIVTFTEAMDPATINAATFIVTGPDNFVVPGVYSSDATGKIWTFNPTYNLSSSSSYNITITTEAKGISGNSLSEDFIWGFTTNNALISASNYVNGGVSSNPVTAPTTPTIPILTTIVLSPASTNLTAGSTQQLTNINLDQFGSPITAVINYTSSNSSIATVNNSGFVTAISFGNVTITASSGAINGTSQIYVTGTSSILTSVNLGTAGNFAILAKSAISTTGATSIVGDIGISPAAASFITGFAQVLNGTYSSSSLVTGKIYAADYIPPTPANMTTAISNMQAAYVDASGRPNPTATELGAGNINGMTLTPGLYKWSTGLNISTGVTLDCQGNSSAVFIFQIAQALTVGNGAVVTLTNGCQASNIFWQVAGLTTLGTTSNFKGNILDLLTIAMNNGATLNGRALSQDAVTLIANLITKP